MPRVLKIDSITHRPICKTAGAGGFSGHNYLCHSKARIGVTGQCKRCTIPFFESGVSIDKMVGCGEAVACGSTLSGTGWDFDLSFGTGSSYAATQTNPGDGTAADEWAGVKFTGSSAALIEHGPFTYKWSGGTADEKTTQSVADLAPGAAGIVSVTITDNKGKSKTAEMPAIYTRFITWPALNTFLGQGDWGILQGTSGGQGASLSAGLILEVILAKQTGNFEAAVLGGKGPFLVGIHAMDWNHANDNDPAVHAAAEAATIKLTGPNGPGWTPTAGNEYLTEVSPPGDAYKAVFHTSAQQYDHHALPALTAVDPGVNPPVWPLKGGGTVDWDNTQPGGGTGWPNAPGSNIQVHWHLSIRDSEKQGVHVLRLRIADILA